MTSAQEAELIHLRNVIGLAAFAVEARRVLQEVDYFTAQQALDKRARRDPLALVHACMQWAECPDNAAQVLLEVHARLGALLEAGQ